MHGHIILYISMIPYRVVMQISSECPVVALLREKILFDNQFLIIGKT